jgi:hypothetical protein
VKVRGDEVEKRKESFTEMKTRVLGFRVKSHSGLFIPGYEITRPDSHIPTHLKSKTSPARRSCKENATMTTKKLKNDP